MNTNSHTYTVIVEPMSNAFSAILKFDPCVWIEFEEGDEVAETYTINSAHDLSAVIEAAPGLITWCDQKIHGYSVSVNYFILGEAESRPAWKTRCSWGTGETPTVEKPAFIKSHLLGYAPGDCEYIWLVASPLTKEAGSIIGWIPLKDADDAERWMGEPLPALLQGDQS